MGNEPERVIVRLTGDSKSWWRLQATEQLNSEPHNVPDKVAALLRGEKPESASYAKAVEIRDWGKNLVPDAEPDLQFLALPGKVPIDWADE